MKYSALMLKLFGYAFGIVTGVFLGLFVIGTIIRLLLDMIFHYGDSGPFWVTVVIVVCTLLSVVACTRISMSWVRVRLVKNGLPGRTMPRERSAAIKNG